MVEITRTGARLEALLNKQVRYRGEVMTWREVLRRIPEYPDKSVTHGSFKWSRRRFNRMDAQGQAAYEERLSRQRVYSVNGVVVPKTIYDAVPGVVVQDVDGNL